MNFSHTLYNHTDCLKRLEFFINERDQSVGRPPHVEFGIKMHKIMANYVQNNVTPHPMTDGPQEYVKFLCLQSTVDEFIPQCKNVELRLERHTGVMNVVGEVDILLNDGSLIDYKFTKKGWTTWKLQNYTERQALLYFYILEPLMRPVQMIYIIVPENGKIEKWVVPYDENQVKMEVHKWNSLWYSIESAKKFGFSPNASEWNCRFCPYKDKCEFKK